MKITPDKWIWYGTPGHFVCAWWCRFHLCTKVGEYLVSTVGEYVHPRHSGGNETTEREWLKKNWPGEDIGHGRKYETMVFRAGKICTDPKCNCKLPEIDGPELDYNPYNERGAASVGHYEMCAKWANK